MSLGLRIKWNLLQVKMVVVVVVLCFASRVSRSLAQGQTPEIDDDLLCLQSLQSSLSGKGVEFLTGNWTGLEFPCKGNTSYSGLLCNNGQVIDISLRSMSLEGTIPSGIIQCNALANLDLSDNRLSGTIPPEIGQLEQLVVLNLSLNRLGGEIPDFSKAKFTNVIDLHGNDLTGNIPSSLGFLERLSTFDVSDNDLSGPIPQNLANDTATGEERFNASSFEGNRGLYGYPLQPPSNHGLSVLAIVGIGLGSGMLSLIVSFTAVCIWLRVTEQRGAAEEGKISQLMPES